MASSKAAQQAAKANVENLIGTLTNNIREAVVAPLAQEWHDVQARESVEKLAYETSKETRQGLGVALRAAGMKAGDKVTVNVPNKDGELMPVVKQFTISDEETYAYGKVIEGLRPHLTPEQAVILTNLMAEHRTPYSKLGFKKG